MNTTHPFNNQRGVALVLVLGLVALVAAWAAAAAREDWISLRQAENLDQSSRAWLACESAFELAARVLREDAKKNGFDALNELWAQESPPFPVDDGQIAVTIRDANRYYNINDLVTSDGYGQAGGDGYGQTGGGQVSGLAKPLEVAFVKRLFSKLELDPILVDAIVDWEDADDEPFGTAGAESSAYADRPWKPKNGPLDRLDELLLIHGFDADKLAKLRTVLIARKSSGIITPININTAPKELLLALADTVTTADAEMILTRQPENPFTTVAEFTSLFPAWGAQAAPRISVSSDAFLVDSHARFGRVIWGEQELMKRNQTSITVLWRQRLGWDL